MTYVQMKLIANIGQKIYFEMVEYFKNKFLVKPLKDLFAIGWYDSPVYENTRYRPSSLDYFICVAIGYMFWSATYHVQPAQITHMLPIICCYQENDT